MFHRQRSVIGGPRGLSLSAASQASTPPAAAFGAPPAPLDLPAFVTHACQQLQAPFSVRFLHELQEEYVMQSVASKKSRQSRLHVQISKSSRALASSPLVAAPRGASTASAPVDDSEVVVAAVRDAAGRLVELAVRRAATLPRLLLRVLALAAPYQPHLARLAARRLPLDGAALHDLARLLAASYLTELLLDDSPVPALNQHLLLETPSRLRRLSLDRCALGDEGCTRLAAALTPPAPATVTLALLSLVSNGISDEGVRALAVALRSNRSLQHLNLAGNRITDAGAAALFSVLVEFPLTGDEVIGNRRRLLEYHRARRAAYERILEELIVARAVTEGGAGARRRTVVRARSAGVSARAAPSAFDALSAKAGAMAEETVGARWEPFPRDETVPCDGLLHSRGNLALCYLNLAYNQLEFPTLRRLLRVLRYQAATAAGGGTRGAGAAAGKRGAGLVRVVLAGNALPDECEEQREACALLELALDRRTGVARRPPRASKTKGP